jgi:hypothetical protein
MKLKFIIYLITFFSFSYSFAAELPHASPEMQKASFWIARDPLAEETILDTAGLGRLNLAIYRQNEFMYRLEDLEEVISGEEVKTLIGDPQLPPKIPYYSPAGKLYTAKFYKALEENLNLAALPDKVKAVFGLTLTRTNLRTHPTLQAALKKPGEKSFDRFQDTSLEPAQFVARIHTSKDGKFAYVLAAYDRGWVLEKDIAWAAGKKEVEEYFRAPNFLVNLAPQTPVYEDAKNKKSRAPIHMGTALPLLKGGRAEPWIVKIPAAGAKGELVVKEGYISPGADVREGYLPYSAANIIRQAFKLLGDPYDWGGKKGGRDCSQFILEIFATCGVHLPRNSSYQAEAAAEVYSVYTNPTSSKKEKSLHTARPGITLLQAPGHIMLYLGEYQGRFYVIHDAWGYTDANNNKSIIKIAQVAVTDLSLEKKNPARSLLEKTTKIVEVNHDYPWE